MRHGNIEQVRNLLIEGANPNARNLDGATPLFVAADLNLRDIMSLLVVAGAGVNASNPLFFSETVLYHKLGDVKSDSKTKFETIKLLLDLGADPNLGVNYTPLRRAVCDNPNPNIIKLLLDRGADPDKKFLNKTLIPEVKNFDTPDGRRVTFRYFKTKDILTSPEDSVIKKYLCEAEYTKQLMIPLELFDSECYKEARPEDRDAIRKLLKDASARNKKLKVDEGAASSKRRGLFGFKFFGA